MKKAKKLLAILMAMVMLASAAYLPVYAKTSTSSYNVPDRMTSNEKYCFGAEKGASYILDMLDDMLREAHISLSWDYLVNSDNSIGGSIGAWALDSLLSMPPIDLTSIDAAVDTIYTIIDKFDSGLLGGIANLAIGNLLDYLNKNGLDQSVKRGVRSDGYATGSSDMKVLYNLLSWLSNNTGLFVALITGNLDAGLLDSTLKGIKIAGLPILEDIDTNVGILLYKMLVDDDDTITALPAGETLETAVQKVIDWALITGTGEDHENGGYSLLGANFEPLIGADAMEIGDASITDISFYQFINNIINGLLNGFLAPELGGILADLVGVKEDGTIDADDMTMFNTIIGVIVGLLTDNGADPPVYSEEEGKRTPMGQINDLVDWLLKDGALQVFIKIDITGLGLTDNFMSLLQDLIRIAINLLPVLGLEIPDGILPSSDELSATWYYKVNEETGEKSLCEKNDEAVVDQLYKTYTGERVCYAVYDDAGEIDYYRYYDDETAVNTADDAATGYENPDFIRPYYKMSNDGVWAAVMKAVFTLFLDAPYFPKWTTTMESVLAYGCAGLATPIIPSGDWYDRLDAYHLSNHSTAPYPITSEKTVNPIAYSNADARGSTALPTGAMEILAGVGAYYLNTMLDLSAAQQFTTVATSFEQLLTELCLWAMTTYLPVLASEIDPTTGKAYTTEHAGPHGETRYPGTFATQTNTLIDACYTNFGSRIIKDNPDWYAVYDYIDNTLLSLIPASWLPAEFYDSQALFNDWLFGNILEFDIQGLLSILSMNPGGELEQPVLTVLLRVIDRVFATVFCSEAVMLPADRNGTGDNSVFARHTTITTLTALLEDGDGADDNASLPTLFRQLLTLLNKHKGLLLATLFPLLMDQAFERPFDRDALNMDDSFVNVLGTDMTRYRIHDLEDQIFTLVDHANTTRINSMMHLSTQPGDYVSYATEAEALAAEKKLGDRFNMIEAVDQQQEDGTVKTVYNVYENIDEDFILKAYAKFENIYVEKRLRTAATVNSPAVYSFDVYQQKSHYLSADATEATDDYGTYTKFSNFEYRTIVPTSATNPIVKWDDGEYYFWSIEDANPNAYYYANAKDAVTDARSFIDSYYALASNDLSAAFGEWFKYSIDAHAVKADIYDTNGDGKAVLSTTDSDYVADVTNTDGSVTKGVPVDGFPGAPDAMFPYYSESDTASQTWVDFKVDNYVTQARNTFNSTNYEVLQIAESYNTDPGRRVLLDATYTERVVRYALWLNNGNDSAAALQFGILKDEKGEYKCARQWEHLTATEIDQIKAFCDGYFMYLEQNEETGEYEIYRKPFDYANKLSFFNAPDGATALSNAPIASRHYIGDAGPTDYQAAQNAIYDGYESYINTLYATRRSLYNQIDNLSWRFEEAEINRSVRIDTTMLEWALRHVKGAYISSDNLRNLKFVNTVDGVDQYTKIYTSSSYAEFQKAYDYADCLIREGLAQASGVTQSMVTKAYNVLIDAYNRLVDYLGDADWVQYYEYLKLAKEIAKTKAEGGYADDEDFGITVESRQALNDIIQKSIAAAGDLTEEGDAFRKENFDCERQAEVDALAASINAVILNLKYLSNPGLEIKEGSSNLKVTTSTETDNEGRVYTYGWIIGLKEGEGLVLDNVTEKGMQINETKGDYLALEESDYGKGTGAKINGYIDTMTRFRYYGVLYGDLNGDARVDGTDWAKLSYYLLTGTTSLGMGEAYMLEAANADHMGEITINDAQLIRDHYNYTKTIDQTTPSTGTASIDL